MYKNTMPTVFRIPRDSLLLLVLSSLKRFLTAMPVRYEVAEPTTLQINAVEVTFDELHATDIKRINISYVHYKEGMEAESENGS